MIYIWNETNALPFLVLMKTGESMKRKWLSNKTGPGAN